MLDDTIRNKIEYYCAYQERCHEEVRGRLYELRCPHEDIDEYLSHLIENNFLNEMRYAEQYVSGKFRIKKWGRKKIEYQLRMKKISDYCIGKAMQLIEEDEYERILSELINKKAEEYGAIHPLIKKKKIYQYMMQKGYETELIAAHTRILFDKKN